METQGYKVPIYTKEDFQAWARVIHEAGSEEAAAFHVERLIIEARTLHDPNRLDKKLAGR